MDNKYLIEKYLRHNLSVEEQQVFDKLISKDTNFKKEVDFQTNLQKAIVQDDEDNFRHFINELEQKKPKKLNYTRWIIAASLVALFGLIFMFIPKEDNSVNTLYASNFKPYKNVIAPQVRGNKDDSEKNMAFIAYEKKDYELAIAKFDELYNKTKEPYYLFYKANALLQIGKTEEAIPLLKAHLNTNDSLVEKSNWYLALAYLKIDDVKQAKLYLNKIVKDNLYHSKKAKYILAKLN